MLSKHLPGMLALPHRALPCPSVMGTGPRRDPWRAGGILARLAAVGGVGHDGGMKGRSSPDGRTPGRAMGRFSRPTRDWFLGAFSEPTPAQDGAWNAISSGSHALVVAPTGSGKTLAAFLWALDRLLFRARR